VEHKEVLQIDRIVLYVLIANLSIDNPCPSKRVSDAYERGSDAIYLLQYVIFIPACEHFEQDLVPKDPQTAHISSAFVLPDMVWGMFEVVGRRKHGSCLFGVLRIPSFCSMLDEPDCVSDRAVLSPLRSSGPLLACYSCDFVNDSQAIVYLL
jgi:hypothetical protein